MVCFKKLACIVSIFVSAVYVPNLCGQAAAKSSPADGPPAQTESSTKPDAVPASNMHGQGYVIGSDDVLSISVWKEPDLTKSVPVRYDGKITLPLVGELQAAGRTPTQLEKDITVNLSSFITDPEVTVTVQQINSQKFNILGNVSRPGSYQLTTGTTVVDAIALAGGFRDFAKKKSMYILRPNPRGQQFRLSFNYDTYIKGKNTLQNIAILPRDTIVVP